MTPTPLSPQVQEWRRMGTHLITIATLTAEIAALKNEADKDAEEPETQQANDRAAAALREAVGHLSAIPFNQVVPEGWKLVPIEPTPEMIAAVSAKPHPTRPDRWDSAHIAIYRGMLAASPQPVRGEALPAEQPKPEIAYPTSASGGNDLQTAPSDADFVRDLLWNEHTECCGSPVAGYGGEYMGQREEVMSCCGCPEPAPLNDAQIVATLRARFPNV